jgi:hypothetical protein
MPISRTIGLTLVQALVNNVGIEYLYLSEDECYNEECNHDELTIRLCVIDHVVGNAVGAALYFNHTLTTLNLEYNNLGDEVCGIIATSLHVNVTLKRLSLGGNYITNKGAEVMAEALKVNIRLQNLSFDDNDIGNTGIKVLADALKINTTLRFLRLDRNIFTTVVCLADMLQVNRSLRTLRLDDNSFGNKSAVALATSLEINTTLTVLSLQDNAIGVRGGQAFMATMLFNTTLIECDLEENHHLNHRICTTISNAATANRHRRDTQTWSAQKHAVFHPVCHKRFFTILLAAQRSTLPQLPIELWTMHILPCWRYKDVMGVHENEDLEDD